jgi:UDP-N-acetylmuramoylalanine-D-glutamate ligase
MLSERLTADHGTDNLRAQQSRATDLAEAVEIASSAAVSGEVILLAPGGTSFDAYVDFAARGNHFRSLVKEIADRLSYSLANSGI